ncbi:MAG: hypothetical protein B7Z37_22065 [Verrucomicrobia bacterium 12-59-8]|nr:MAG: hypothetical protein B7Z37_22065 [Verrucomicrobia bacterium 12-59-8]
MKLADLKRYLTNKKLLLAEEERKRHLHFQLVLEGGIVPLPTILCIQHGSGDANRNNLKGVAEALGLSLRELETSMGCLLSRECVLVKLAWALLGWAQSRFEDYLVSQDSKRGYLAMIVSARLIVEHVKRQDALRWSATEKKALHGILNDIPGFNCHLPEAKTLLIEFSRIING